MPIRLNFLAEAQALEELRRRDPVKRAIVGGVLLLVAILIWSSSLMFQKTTIESTVEDLEKDLNSKTGEYKQILDNEKRLNESKQKLAALRQLSTNRFLIGNLLNGMQKSVVENVQLVHLQLEQKYVFTEKKTNETTSAVIKPATVTEKITLVLDAKDSSPTPGDAVSKFQETLSRSPYFHEMLGRTNGFRLKGNGVAPPQTDTAGRTFVLFSVEAHFPDKTR